MPAIGKVEFDGKTFEFKEGESFGVLDWGRGVWTYKNTWYWGSASGQIDKVPFGWNIGYGFGRYLLSPAKICSSMITRLTSWGR